MGISVQRKIYSTKQLFTALGLPLRGHWRTRKPKLMGHLHQYGTECLIVDDAHDLSLEHLMLIKEVTDQGRLPHKNTPRVAFFSAGSGNPNSFKADVRQPEPPLIRTGPP